MVQAAARQLSAPPAMALAVLARLFPAVFNPQTLALVKAAAGEFQTLSRTHTILDSRSILIT
jgi:hypothetical protein